MMKLSLTLIVEIENFGFFKTFINSSKKLITYFPTIIHKQTIVQRKKHAKNNNTHCRENVVRDKKIINFVQHTQIVGKYMYYIMNNKIRQELHQNIHIYMSYTNNFTLKYYI